MYVVHLFSFQRSAARPALSLALADWRAVMDILPHPPEAVKGFLQESFRASRDRRGIALRGQRERLYTSCRNKQVFFERFFNFF